MPVQFRVEEDPKYGLTHKTGTISFDHELQGRQLEIELLHAGEKFIRDMELKGLTLYNGPLGPKQSNPMWIEKPDGEYAAFYAIDWTGERAPTAPQDGGVLPHDREMSLEDSEGMVEYRIVGIFWAPSVSYEYLTSRADRLEKEKQEKNPMSFAT